MAGDMVGLPLADRLMRLVSIADTGCWEYSGAKNKNGYSQIRVGSRRPTVQRAAYELFVGPIPQGMEVDHTCHNRGCVNPEHLRTVTRKQNEENLSGARANSRTGVRGVFPDSKPGTYRTNVTHHGKSYSKSGFRSVEEASKYVVALRNRLFTHNDADRSVALHTQGA